MDDRPQHGTGFRIELDDLVRVDLGRIQAPVAGECKAHGAATQWLSAQARIFRDGKLIFTGAVSTIDAAQSDLKRVPSVGRLQLGPEFEPGQYVLQVVVTDQLAKEKEQIASQWIDFEIVK
jgi:hypothetical protein